MITPIKITNFSIAYPAIGNSALRIHYEQHYLKYIHNLNKIIDNNNWIKKTDSIEMLILIADPYGDLYNNAAQVWNHEFFFNQFTDNAEHEVGPKFEYLIHSRYDSIENFIKDCIKVSSSHFGSGYLWVYLDERFRLIVETGNNAENLVKRKRCTPILCIDLWEHSYYVDYLSDRISYIKSIINQINWNVIENRLSKIRIE